MDKKQPPARLMRKCPSCARYVHLDEWTKTKCEYCGEATDFEQFRPVEQKAVLAAESGLLRLLIGSTGIPGSSRKQQRSALFLVLALPIVLFWLIAGNPMDVEPLTQTPSPAIEIYNVYDF